jgi:transcriptional regulator NrdR family protein
MNCQTCGEPVNDVVDVRKNPENVWRRRKCRKCGATWSTVESANPSDAVLYTVIDGLRQAQAEITDAMATLKKVRSRGGAG